MTAMIADVRFFHNRDEAETEAHNLVGWDRPHVHFQGDWYGKTYWVEAIDPQTRREVAMCIDGYMRSLR